MKMENIIILIFILQFNKLINLAKEENLADEQKLNEAFDIAQDNLKWNDENLKQITDWLKDSLGKGSAMSVTVSSIALLIVALVSVQNYF